MIFRMNALLKKWKDKPRLILFDFFPMKGI